MSGIRARKATKAAQGGRERARVEAAFPGNFAKMSGGRRSFSPVASFPATHKSVHVRACVCVMPEIMSVDGLM